MTNTKQEIEKLSKKDLKLIEKVIYKKIEEATQEELKEALDWLEGYNLGQKQLLDKFKKMIDELPCCVCNDSDCKYKEINADKFKQKLKELGK